MAKGGRHVENGTVMRLIDHIESHLTDDRDGVLDTAALADLAGYSPFHFIRLFRAAIGLTPADYIRKRRISEIVSRIGREDRPLSDIAFAFGFNSKENFTRAFRREHRISPSDYRRSGSSLRLYPPFSPEERKIRPEASLGFRDELTVVAYPYREKTPPHAWNLYNAERRSLRLSGGTPVEDVGVMKRDPGTGELSYWIGIPEKFAKGDLTGTVRVTIPGGLYAFFRTPEAGRDDFVAAIRYTWEYIRDVWLPQNGYRRKEGCECEIYAEWSRTYRETICIPIEKEEKDG